MTVATRPLGVAVVGLGVGEQHALAYARHPECRIELLYDPDLAHARAVAARVGGGEVAPDFESILTDPRVDIVSIASPDDAHYVQVCAVLASDRHVFVEKPMCRSRGELEDVKRTWNAHGRPYIGSNLVLRAAPLYQWLKSAIDAGELGEIYAVDGDYLYGRLEKITDGWRSEVEDYSVMQGGGVHLVDLMLWLTGQRPEHVTAAGNRVCSRGTAFRYNDFMAATFRFPGGRDGIVGRITANFGCVHRHHHVLRVFGTRATFIYDDAGARLHRTADPQGLVEPVALAPLAVTKGDLIPGVVDTIRAGARSDGMAQHDFDVISVCLAADLAAEEATGKDIEYT
jgi:predicted dehydrogenase